MILLCKSSSNSNHFIYSDNLFVSMTSIKACHKLNRTVLSSGEDRKDCNGFPPILNRHSQNLMKFLDLGIGEYESLYTECEPEIVAVVWFDSENTRQLGANSASEENVQHC